MRNWLKQTAVRLWIVLTVLFILAAILFWLPEHNAKHTVKQQATESSELIGNIQSTTKTLNSLPAIDKIQTQQQSVFKSYTDQAQKADLKLRSIGQEKYSSPSHIYGIGRLHKTLLEDTNSAVTQTDKANIYKTGADDIQKSLALMNYQAKVSDSLTNLLEYNPSQDMAGFNLNSADTNQRLKLAQQGLSKTLNQLNGVQGGQYQDPLLQSVIAQVKGLQADINKLSSTGDAAEWIKSIDSAQQAIIHNRQQFWITHSRLLNNELSHDNNAATMINTLWLNLAKTYSQS
jgi:hypothetical protein